MKLGKLEPSREAVEPQENSPLAKGLTDIFSDLQEKQQELKETSTDQKQDLIEYFQKNLEPKFKKLVKQHVGFEVHDVQYEKQPSINAAVVMHLYNRATTIDSLKRYSGFGPLPEWMKDMMKMKIASYKNLKKVSDALDKSEGKIDKDVARKMNLQVTLVMDVMSMASLTDYIHPEAESLSPEEAASVWLHELGHQVSLIERCADQYFKFEVKYAALDSFSKNASYKEQMKYVSEIADNDDMADVSEKTSLMKRTADRLANSFTSKIDSESSDPDNVPSSAGETAKESFKKGVDMVSTLLMLIFHTLIVSVGVLGFLFDSVFDNLTKFVGLRSLGWGKKMGDISNTVQQNTLIERLADEFVSMHGLGAEQGSALNKLHTAAALINLPMIPSLSQNNSRRYAAIVHVYALILNVCIREDERIGDYEDLDHRLQSLRQDAAKVLQNDESMSSEVISHYIKEYEKLGNLLRKRINQRSKKSVKFVDSMFKLFETITDGYSLFDIVMDAKFRQKYAEVAEAVKNLQASPLFKHAAKLKQLEEGKQ